MKNKFLVSSRRSYYNNSFSNNSKLFRYYCYIFFNKVFYFVLLIMSIIILNYTTNNKSTDIFIRNSIFFITKPVFLVVELPFNLIFDFGVAVKNILLTNQINKELKKENLFLQNTYIQSIDIKGENENLKKLLNFVNLLPFSYQYITTNIYAESKNSLNNRFILNVGLKQGVQEGNIILGINQSVIGRVININDNFSDVLLLTDITSKIPARTANTKERIILSGKNNSLLEISYFNSKNPSLEDGDLVFTSGDANIILDGLFIGKIKKINNVFYVEMNEDTNKVFDAIIIISKENIL